MRAAVIRQYGPPDVLILDDHPMPEPGRGEVRVRVAAAALNPIDAEKRKGRFAIPFYHRLPMVLGSDLAGWIDAAGPGAEWAPGTPVYGMIPTIKGGAYASYAVLQADQVARLPEGLDMTEAAAMPLAALTALQALRDLAGLRAGQRLMVNGCSGGVGTFALQLGRLMGAHVTGVCSARNEALARELGAAEVIDYTATDIRALDVQFDVYFDVYGNMPLPRAQPMIVPGGAHVTTIPAPANFVHALRSRLGKVRSHVVIVTSRRADLETLAKYVEDGTVRPVVDRTYPLEDAAAAHTYLETRRARGKVVLAVEDTVHENESDGEGGPGENGG